MPEHKSGFPMKGLRLYKKERLCSRAAIDALFSGDAGGASAVAYPWRAVWRASDSGIARFVFTVPKRRLRKAVDRVAMRRRGREAYRLNRNILSGGAGVDIAFIYVADSTVDYARTQHSIVKLLTRIAGSRVREGEGNDNV